jgi:ADP-heptose:LPS heptosyltransferase
VKKNVIYIIRKRAFGDALWMEPILKKISQNYKRVVVYTKFPDLFANYPIKNVEFRSELSILIKLLIKIEGILGISFFSINLEMSYEKSPHQHILNAYQEKARLPLTRDYPRIYLSDKEKDSSSKIKDKYVILHISAVSSISNYRNVYGINWTNILEHIKTKGYKIIEIGDPPGKFPNFYQGTSMREMIELISKASFFIGLDSGPSHIAASFKIPAIIFFGAINPNYRHFIELFNGFILQQPCIFAGCYHTKHPKKEHICQLVGKHGIPLCCQFTDITVVNTINKLIEKYLKQCS